MRIKTLLTSLLIVFYIGTSMAQEKIPIWNDVHVKGARKVGLIPFIADENPDGKAIIVCPGGSYYWLDKKVEGDSVAMWLRDQGITTFVLHYRTAGVPAFAWRYRYLFRGYQYPDMQTDAQRALQWVREHAEEYHINPEKVGMLGFSAGGHLVLSAAFFKDHDYLKQVGVVTETSLQPAFVASLYPVVTMAEDCVHKRSRRGLLGDTRVNDAKLQDSLSLERHVPKDCPPIFLVNCVDDPVVDYRNSVLLDEALTAAGVNHRYIQYATGGHGFGMSNYKGSAECHAWKEEFVKWLKEIGF